MNSPTMGEPGLAMANSSTPHEEVEMGDMADGKVTTDNPTKHSPCIAIGRCRIYGLFERASDRWWDPSFDSDVLEKEFKKLSFPRERQSLRYALSYSIFSGILWCILLGLTLENNVALHVGSAIVFIVLCLVIFILTFFKVFRRLLTGTAILLSVILSFFCLLNFASKDGISQIGCFAISVEILLLFYTMVPLPFYVCVGVCVVYSVAFEVLSAVRSDPGYSAYYVIPRAFLHLAVHLIGIYIYITMQVRKRSTFLKVGQSIMSRRDLEIEKDLKSKMINSLMPEKVAKSVIETQAETEDINDTSVPNDAGRLTFRNFYMSQMENVSILFADIVGFTKMSSNKTAEELVSLLSDLFGRFDRLCTESGCEKISTLGDCYYCVSGCPEARADHAECCVEMGLKMCVAIQEFDKDHNEEVNMRVGVHTGTVLCGLVGTRRFKFDVWSHDVTIANLMESEGEAGRVHISDSTYQFVKDLYDTEPGESIPDIRAHKQLIEYYDKEKQGYHIKHIQDETDIKTMFIVGRKQPKEVRKPEVVVVEAAANNLPDVPKITKVEINSEPEHIEEELPTAVLLGQRHLFTSTEEIGNESSDNIRTGILSHVIEDPNQKDNLIISCMRKDSHVEDYLFKPPMNYVTLNFSETSIERNYRNRYRATSTAQRENSLDAPHFSALFDLFLASAFSLFVSACCVLSFTTNQAWVIIFSLSMALCLCLALPILLYICCSRPALTSVSKLAFCLSNWYVRHIWGALIASLPIGIVFCYFSCGMFKELSKSLKFLYFIALLAGLPHFCNFSMVSSWYKSLLATVAGVVSIVILELDVCKFDIITAGLKYEYILDVVLVLLLIWFLNWETEMNYRLSYHGDIQAERDKRVVQLEKDRAEWLLHNIIPEHVSDVLKLTSKYCKSHQDVGVVFAKISNFEEYYEEGFEGGREYLRVLNEMVGDMEELFNDERFKDVEKIKTIGACLMVASGLNPNTRSQNKHPDAHLYALMLFAQELLKKLEEFNQEIFNFDFDMKIGFNLGPVTAGVIGTTKLHYDIWGDTVNVSSRMYSTGQAGAIQVTEENARRLEPMFEFKHRGQTFVKGKGQLNTYLLVKQKDDASWD